MAGTIYLIDFENVGNKWAEAMDGAGDGDTAVLFYSDNSPKAMLDQMELMDRRGVRMRFRKCVPGPSALDFQLSSELGMLIGREEGTDYRILSDDRGYDALEGYWAASGVSVSRVGTGAGPPDQQAGKPEGMAREPARRAVDAWLDGPMTQMGLAHFERSHVLGCARACLEKHADPEDRMARFRSDTLRIKGRAFLEKCESGLGPALEGLFRTDRQ